MCKFYVTFYHTNTKLCSKYCVTIYLYQWKSILSSKCFNPEILLTKNKVKLKKNIFLITNKIKFKNYTLRRGGKNRRTIQNRS